MRLLDLDVDSVTIWATIVVAAAAGVSQTETFQRGTRSKLSVL
jgi:hypothetical protein